MMILPNMSRSRRTGKHGRRRELDDRLVRGRASQTSVLSRRHVRSSTAEIRRFVLKSDQISHRMRAVRISATLMVS
jgi:hypothetical protein